MAENTSSRLTSMARNTGSTKEEKEVPSREVSTNRYLGTSYSASATKYGTAVPLDRGREVLEKYSETHASHEISSTINLEQSI